LGLWQGRGIIGESSTFNNPSRALIGLQPLPPVMPSTWQSGVTSHKTKNDLIFPNIDHNPLLALFSPRMLV
jgi:hypothetical protein